MPTVVCPFCGTPLQFPNNAVGRRGTCGRCQGKFRVREHDVLAVRSRHRSWHYAIIAAIAVLLLVVSVAALVRDSRMPAAASGPAGENVSPKPPVTPPDRQADPAAEQAADKLRDKKARDEKARDDKRAAERAEAEQRQKMLDREFQLLNPGVQNEILAVRQRLAETPLDRLPNADLITISKYWQHFPSVPRPGLLIALARYGDAKGAEEHLDILGIQDTGERLRVRAAFGMLNAQTCKLAKGLAPHVRRGDVATLGTGSREFIRDHPELFPTP